ncbi:MAG: LysR substrate-binding domain-containing protein [Propionivibrio sp.]
MKTSKTNRDITKRYAGVVPELCHMSHIDIQITSLEALDQSDSVVVELECGAIRGLRVRHHSVSQRYRMTATHRQLPQLQSLVYFESAARHLNFTAAAEELGTTQPAVSHRVKSMEEHLGISLFLRQHRGVKLTAEGVRLYETVRSSLNALRLTTAEVRFQDEQRTITLATDFGFAKFWLMPRIHLLRAAIPGIQLRLLTSQEEIDPHAGEIDISIHYKGSSDDAETELLFPETVIPVCSPDLLHGAGAFKSAQALCKFPLLHLQQVQPRRWMDWSDWITTHAPSTAMPSPSLVFNDYSLVIQAAISGHGIALGWRPLVDELLDRGDLVAAFDRPLDTTRGCYLALHRPGRPSGVLSKFRDWIVTQCSPSFGMSIAIDHGTSAPRPEVCRA